MLLVHEILLSLQGESTWAGRPAVIVRLAGCPLECRWCDTIEARNPDKGSRMTIAAACEAVKGLAEPGGVPGVTTLVTGGEPLFQEATPVLLAAICDAGYPTSLETSGSLPIRGLDPRVKIVMDLKCPSSGMSDRNLFENLGFLKPIDEVKFVIADRQDFEWACEVIRDRGISDQAGAILFSPVRGRCDAKDLSAWILERRPPARLQIQLHRLLGFR